MARVRNLMFNTISSLLITKCVLMSRAGLMKAPPDTRRLSTRRRKGILKSHGSVISSLALEVVRILELPEVIGLKISCLSRT